MSAFILQYTLADFPKMAERFQNLAKKGKDKSKMANIIMSQLVMSATNRFDEKKTPDGRPWRSPLYRTGTLSKSVLGAADETTVNIGSNLKYAAIHQFGGEIAAKTAAYLKFKINEQWVQTKKVNIPANPYVGMSNEDRAAIEEKLAEELL